MIGTEQANNKRMIGAEIGGRETEQSERARRLCQACGMCCNGVLFHQVALQKEDNARKLAALGLKIKGGKRAVLLQPCAAHDGQSCRIYEDRPGRCRIFQCRQRELMAVGKQSEAEAQAAVAEARRRIGRVLALLEEGGEAREHKTLAQRCLTFFVPPLDPSEEAQRHRELLELASRELEEWLAVQFRTAEAG